MLIGLQLPRKGDYKHTLLLLMALRLGLLPDGPILRRFGVLHLPCCPVLSSRIWLFRSHHRNGLVLVYSWSSIDDVGLIFPCIISLLTIFPVPNSSWPATASTMLASLPASADTHSVSHGAPGPA